MDFHPYLAAMRAVTDILIGDPESEEAWNDACLAAFTEISFAEPEEQAWETSTEMVNEIQTSIVIANRKIAKGEN